MDISQVRNAFTVFVVDSDFSTAQGFVETLKATGYHDISYFPTLESALATSRQSPPHIILFDHERFADASETFLTEIASLSEEILVILMISSRQSLSAFQLISRRLAYDSVMRPLISTLEVVQKMDRAAERLYYQFESEQLRDHYERGQIQAAVESAIARDEDEHRAPNTDRVELVGLNDYINQLSSTKELDKTIQHFMDAVSKTLANTPVLYFKYVPSHMSLLVSQASGLPIEKFRGVGIDLIKEGVAINSPKNLTAILQNPAKLGSLGALIEQVFGQKGHTTFTHTNDGEVLGLFSILDEVRLENEQLQFLKRTFELAYKRNVTLKEKHALDITDPLTGLLNRRRLREKLDNEISRSRRIRMPLSLITLDIDGFSELNDRLGFQQADSLLRAVAMILKKTARANDIIARTGPDEFICLLPHTGHMGGAVKAERVRRIIESTKFPLLTSLGLGPLTVSCGISEYPSICGDADGLIRTADEALMEVKRVGGNRVCLATAPSGFQMDFTPIEVPSGPKLSKQEAR